MFFRHFGDGLSLQGIVWRKRLADDLQLWIDQIADLVCKVVDSEFFWIANIDRSGLIAIHEANHAFDEIVDIAKTVFEIHRRRSLALYLVVPER